MKQTRCHWLLLAALPLLTGCPHNEYVIELRATATGLQRELTCSRQDTGTNGAIEYREFPADELAQISRCYAQAGSASSNIHSFSGVFSGGMPADLDGWGKFSCLTSSLGQAFFYLERFRGSTNLTGQIAERLKAVDELVDLLLGWTKKELGREKNYRELRKQLDTKLRRDLKEISLAWLLKGSVEENDLLPALIERGYFAEGTLMGMEHPALLALLRSYFRSALKLPTAASDPAGLRSLRTQEAFVQSASNYLSSTKQYKLASKASAGQAVVEERPNSLEVVQDLADRAFAVYRPSKNAGDQLQLRLHLPVAPAASNGDWQEDERAVSWKISQPPRNSEYGNPAENAYATWAVADQQTQERIFGGLVLTNQALVDYCQWQHSLSPDQKRQWNALLESLKPGSTTALATFEFREDLPKQVEHSLADYARHLLWNVKPPPKN